MACHVHRANLQFSLQGKIRVGVNYSMIATCFLCQKRSLELRGQDTLLDSFHLHSGDSAGSEGACGPCHYKCLIESKWAAFWYRRIISHSIGTRGYVLLEEHSGYAFLESRHKERFAIRPDGLIFELRRTYFKDLVKIEDGYLLPWKEEVNLDFTSSPDIALEMQNALRADGPYPLPLLLKRLNISDRLVFPVALENAKFISSPFQEKKWSKDWVVATAIYSCFFPDVVINSLRYEK
jgi:hypothetical protein